MKALIILLLWWLCFMPAKGSEKKIYLKNKISAYEIEPEGNNFKKQVNKIGDNVVTTVAGLRNLLNPQVTDVYETTDFGGGIWQYSSETGHTENIGTTIININTGGYFKRLYHGALHDTWFGVVHDSAIVNNNALLAALNYSQSTKQALFIDKGVALVDSYWVPPTLTYLNILSNKDGKICGPYKGTGGSINFINLGRSGSAYIDGVNFEGFKNVIDITNSHATSLIVRNSFCTTGYDSFINMDGDGLSGTLEYLELSDNRVTNTPSGFTCGSIIYKSAIVKGNQIFNLKRDLTRYDLGAGPRANGILVGPLNDINPSMAQELTPSVIITHNAVDGINIDPNAFPDSTASSYYSARGISGGGVNVIIEGNTVKHVNNPHRVDSHGIYVKAARAIVEGNVVVDGTTGNNMEFAAISVKGGIKGVNTDKSYTKPSLVTNNIIYNSDTNNGAVGIGMFGGGDIEIKNNDISGFWGLGITSGQLNGSANPSTPVNQYVLTNHIHDIKSGNAIKIGPNAIKNVVIRGNLIDNMGFFKDSTIVLIGVATSVDTLRNAFIEDNIIINRYTNGSDGSVTFININPKTAAHNIHVQNNKITILPGSNLFAAYGVALNQGTQGSKFEKVFINNNSIINEDVTKVIPIAYNGSSGSNVTPSWVSNLTIGQNYVNDVPFNQPYLATTGDLNFTYDVTNKVLLLTNISANRIVTLPPPNSYQGMDITLRNVNSSLFNWSVSPSIYNADLSSIMNLENGSVYNLYSDGVNWLIRSKYSLNDNIHNQVTAQSNANFNITGNGVVGGQLAIGVTLPTTSDKLKLGGTLSAVANIARGLYENIAYNASANNDFLVGLDMNNTYNTGAFTGVTALDIRSGKGIAVDRTTGAFYFVAGTSGLRGKLSSNSNNDLIYSIVGNNYFQVFGNTGHIAIGNGVLDGGWLTLPKGSSIANSAPIKLISGGMLMTTPEDGSIERDANHLYYTAGTVRKQLDQQIISGGAKSFTGNGTQTVFTVLYTDLGFVPSQVLWTPASREAANGWWIDNITSSSFNLNYISAPASSQTVQGLYCFIK